MEKQRSRNIKEEDLLQSLLIRVKLMTMTRPRVWLEFLLTLPKYSGGGELELSCSLWVQRFILPSISVQWGKSFCKLYNVCHLELIIVRLDAVSWSLNRLRTRGQISPPYIRDSGFTNIVASGVRTDLLCNTQWRRHRRHRRHWRQSQFGQF